MESGFPTESAITNNRAHCTPKLFADHQPAVTRALITSINPKRMEMTYG